jgi:hypothetical protein
VLAQAVEAEGRAGAPVHDGVLQGRERVGHAEPVDVVLDDLLTRFGQRLLHLAAAGDAQRQLVGEHDQRLGNAVRLGPAAAAVEDLEAPPAKIQKRHQRARQLHRHAPDLHALVVLGVLHG